MTQEQELLLALVRGELTGEPPAPDEKTLASVDWDALLREAQQQAVTLMAADALSPFGRFVTNASAWTAAAARQLRANFALTQTEAWLEKTLAPEPMTILKGMSAASYYRRPSGRILGDIDFLVDSAKPEALSALLVKNGCTRVDETESGHHRTLLRGPVVLELHVAIPAIPFGRAGDIVRARAEGVLARSVVRTLDGQSFPSPCEFDHGLILLLHTQNHMQECGVGVRHLCDWAAFLMAEQDAPFWPELLDLLKQIGLLRFAAVLSRVCADYLGAPLPAFAEDAPPELAAAVMEDVLSGGNFGRKNAERSHSSMLMPSFRGEERTSTHMGKLFSRLRLSVLQRYPRAGKNPVLYPFLALYRAVLYAVRSLFGLRPRLSKIAPYAHSREEMFRALRLFEAE